MAQITYYAPAGVTSINLSDGSVAVVRDGKITAEMRFRNDLESAGCSAAAPRDVVSTGTGSVVIATGNYSSGVQMIAIGDSMTARDEGTRASGQNGPRSDGIYNSVQARMAGAIEIAGIYATGGYTIEQVAATHLPKALASAAPIVGVFCGVNNIIGSAEDGDAVFTKLHNLLLLPLLQAGKQIVVGTMCYSADMTAAGVASMRRFNALVRGLKGKYPSNVRVADFNSVMSAADGTRLMTPLAFYDDNTHQSTEGAVAMSGKVAEALAEFGVYPMGGFVRSINSDEWSIDQYGISPNPRVLGVNASGTNKYSNGTGASGSGPDSWNVGCSGTTTAVVNGSEIAVTIGAAGNVCNINPAQNGNFRLRGTDATYMQRGNTTAYRQGEVRVFSTGQFFRCKVAGTTGASEPSSLPSVIGNTVVDGSVTWLLMPDITAANARIRLVTDFEVLSQSGQIAIFQQIEHYGSGYSAITEGVPLYDLQTGTYIATTSSMQNVLGPLSTDSTKGCAAWPTRQTLSYKTPWHRIPASTHWLLPKFRVGGAAGATATIRILGCEVELAMD